MYALAAAFPDSHKVTVNSSEDIKSTMPTTLLKPPNPQAFVCQYISICAPGALSGRLLPDSLSSKQNRSHSRRRGASTRTEMAL